MTVSKGLPSIHLLRFSVFLWRRIQHFRISTPARSNERLRRDTVQRRVSISLARIHIRPHSHLEMQVRQIFAARSPHRADGITALHDLPRAHTNRLQMRIHRLHHRPQFISCWQTMRDEDHPPPRFVRNARINHAPRSRRVNRITQIGILTAYAVQIIS